MSVNGREAAYQALMAVEKSGAWSELYLKNLLNQEKTDSREAALAYRICLGVQQNRTYLSYLIDSVSKISVSKMERKIAVIMLMGAYQLLFLDRVPVHAAVSETVELCRKYSGEKAVGFVNALLRKLSAMRGKEIKLPFHGAERLAVQYSFPLWMAEKFIGLLGEEECEAFFSSSNEIARTELQINTILASLEQAEEALQRERVSFSRHPWLENCLVLTGGGDVSGLKAFQNGAVYVQDAAAKLACLASGVKPGMTVLDGCAAPGGKSFSAAVLMRNHGKILSCDIHANKLSLIRSGAERLGITILDTLQADGRVLNPGLLNSADTVIADVPCSGLGVIRKKPDIRQKQEKELLHLPDIQLSILRNLSRYVKPGGTLLYSTCTVLPEENEGVVEAFLKESDFFPENIQLPGDIKTENGMATLWPHRNGTDGFFFCRMKRKN